MTITLYIVPAMTDQAGQCLIVARNGRWAARQSYAENPNAWHEAGIMNSQGRIVCLNAPEKVYQQLILDEPHMAGLEVQYDTEVPRNGEAKVNG